MKRLTTYLVLFLVLSFSCVSFAEEATASADDNVVADEAAAPADVGVPGLSEEESATAKASEETYSFQAEVSRLMDILINSLYSNTDIFLRELISNASDALDKIRFASLTDKSALGDTPDLEIRISFNKEARTLHIRDTGVGMTKEHLKKHLGVVANSGTTQFVEAAKQGTDALSLIGQFGVGFYSVYLVADRVTVVSKNNDDSQHIWISEADQTFTIAEDPRGNTLGRGTEVILHLKEDATEYLDQESLQRIADKYSQFINFPIYLQKTKTVSKEVPIDAEEPRTSDDPLPPTASEDDDELTDEELKVKREQVEADENEPIPSDDDDIDVSDEEEDEEDDKPKTKTIQEEVSEWVQVNENKAIWTRSPSEISEAEYSEFYKVLSKDEEGSASHLHFSAEGEISFKSILFIPKKAAADLYDKYYGKMTGLKLYVRRVLISDEFEEFLPRYLNFIKGVVDSEDLPLNVSRETLSKSRVLRVMGKKLTRKALDMLRKLAEDDDDEEEEDDTEKDGEEEEKKEKVSKYDEFFKQFGKSIKLGIIEDTRNRAKLSKLLRYQTSKSGDKLISLETYVENMKEGQEHIYYITGENIESVESSPFMERLNKRNLEVIYMVDALDEYVMTNLQDFDGKRFMSITKEGLKFGDETDEEKKIKKAIEKKFTPLTNWLKDVYGEKVGKVVVSDRITDSPCVLVTSQWGWSANMERIMKAQTFNDPEKAKFMKSKKTMEINPYHPIIVKLLNSVDDESEDIKNIANLMLDSAVLQSGFQMDDVKSFGERITRVLRAGLSIPSDAALATDEDLDLEFEEEEPVAEADSEEGVLEDLDLDDEDEDAAHDEL